MTICRFLFVFAAAVVLGWCLLVADNKEGFVNSSEERGDSDRGGSDMTGRAPEGRHRAYSHDGVRSESLATPCESHVHYHIHHPSPSFHSLEAGRRGRSSRSAMTRTSHSLTAQHSDVGQQGPENQVATTHSKGGISLGMKKPAGEPLDAIESEGDPAGPKPANSFISGI